MKRIQKIKFNFIKRSINPVAHEIAQQTIKKICSLGWALQSHFLLYRSFVMMRFLFHPVNRIKWVLLDMR